MHIFLDVFIRLTDPIGVWTIFNDKNNKFILYLLSIMLTETFSVIFWLFKIQFSFMMIFYDEIFFDTQIPESFLKKLNEKLFFLSHETYGVEKYMSTCFALEIS